MALHLLWRHYNDACDSIDLSDNVEGIFHHVNDL